MWRLFYFLQKLFGEKADVRKHFILLFLVNIKNYLKKLKKRTLRGLKKSVAFQLNKLYLETSRFLKKVMICTVLGRKSNVS